jgi:chromosome segregation ATPase
MYFYKFVGHPGDKTRGFVPMSRVFQSQKSPSNSWWNTNRSLPEIADHLERSFEERQALECRLAEVLEENRTLEQRYAQSKADHADECSRLQSEIANLRLQASEMLKRLEQIAAVERRQGAELSAKERLIRDEQERKIQALQLELKNERNLNEKRLQQERSLNEKRVQQLEARIARCICGDVQIDFDDNQPGRSPSPQSRERWKIRNFK